MADRTASSNSPVVVQLDARPACEMPKEGKKIGLDGVAPSRPERNPRGCRTSFGTRVRSTSRRPCAASWSSWRRRGPACSPCSSRRRPGPSGRRECVFAAPRRRSPTLLLLRRVAGFGRRFGGLLLVFGLLRIELAADQLDLRDLRGVAAAMAELEDAGVAAGPLHEARRQLVEQLGDDGLVEEVAHHQAARRQRLRPSDRRP